MKSLIVLGVMAIALSQASNAARPIDAPTLCEVQIEAFLNELDKAKTDAEKEQVRERWRNKRPAWRSGCVRHLLGGE